MKERHYWELALEVLKLWSKYRKLDKLYYDKETKEFDGKAYDEKIYTLNCLDSTLSDFKNSCSSFKVPSIDRRWLFKKIEDDQALCEKLQKRVEKNINSNAAPVAFAQLFA